MNAKYSCRLYFSDMDWASDETNIFIIFVDYTLTWKLNGNVGKNTGNSFNRLYIYMEKLMEKLERILETARILVLLIYTVLI